MMILLLGVLNDEQRALVERIFREHRGRFLRISFKIVRSEENAEDVVSAAFIKIMDNIEKIADLPCPQMTAFCETAAGAPGLTIGTAFRTNAPMTLPTSASATPMCIS